MREYVKPVFEYVQLSLDERLACGSSCDPKKVIHSGCWDFSWNWKTGWGWSRNRYENDDKKKNNNRNNRH